MKGKTAPSEIFSVAGHHEARPRRKLSREAAIKKLRVKEQAAAVSNSFSDFPFVAALVAPAPLVNDLWGGERCGRAEKSLLCANSGEYARTLS
jgi:hypothetical protein